MTTPRNNEKYEITKENYNDEFKFKYDTKEEID